MRHNARQSDNNVSYTMLAKPMKTLQLHHPMIQSLITTYYLEYGRHVVQLHRRRRRRAYAPTSNTAAPDNHEKINTWVSFSYMVMGLCLQLR